MKRQPRADSGDVFAIPVGTQHVVYGQLQLKRPYLIVVFRPLWKISERPSPIASALQEPVLFGVTMDALIWHGDWPIVGHAATLLDRLPRPYYRVQISGRHVIEDFDKRVVRDATEADLAHYDLRWSRSPIAYQHAMEALHGLRPWDPSDDQLLLTHAWAQSAAQPG